MPRSDEEKKSLLKRLHEIKGTYNPVCEKHDLKIDGPSMTVVAHVSYTYNNKTETNIVEYTGHYGITDYIRIRTINGIEIPDTLNVFFNPQFEPVETIPLAVILLYMILTVKEKYSSVVEHIH